MDLAVSRIDKGTQVYTGDGKGNWLPALSGLSDVQSAIGAALGDMDSDGNTDLLVSGKKILEDYESGYGIFLFYGDGAGHWKLATHTGLPQKGLNLTWGIRLADTNGDGSPEIAYCFGIPHSSGRGLEKMPAALQPHITDKHIRQPARDTKSGPANGIRVWTSQQGPPSGKK
jgi:hypothetical protein